MRFLFESLTLATFLIAELGFLGVFVNTLMQTPRLFGIFISSFLLFL